ncbi:MAG: precorrin-8X methylmutase (cobH, cbiC) [Cenarchaeum symbiont of Oopsacas minuta]|nr:precorrin-8X methylmutase (cobH, cbiC) [Cenarchaeum symbiont of Oopsacas minuta]
MQTRKGQSIEDASMAMIENEIGEHMYDKMQWPIVRRVIHSTADFDFANKEAIIFGPNAIKGGIAALKRGCHIVTDVHGVSGLLCKTESAHFGNHIVCKISEPDIAKAAKNAQTTKAQASMRACATELNDGIVAIGNAPTALLELLQMIDEGICNPALIVGIPVGFISAVESKTKLALTNLPYITNKGRKGGSPSAAAIVNALYKLAH